MPPDISMDPVKSEIWGWIAPPENCFTDADIPNLKLLCHWHAVAAHAEQAMEGPIGSGSMEIFEQLGEDDGEKRTVKKHPAIAILKQASSEIRALSDQLGLSPLARSRIGLIQATTVKTAADTAAMFRSIDGAYGDVR